METAVAEGLVATVILLLLIAAATLAISKRSKFPFSVALVLVGIAISQLAQMVPAMAHLHLHLLVSPDVILFVFLPTLIFESAYNLDARQLRANLLPVLTLAVPGLLLSTLIIGGLLWLTTPLDFLPSLLLGSILSATDPVAVIALFRQLGAPKRLTTLVEGESLFNDATAIVVAKILLAIIAAGYFSSDALLQGGVDFITIFFGGIAIGWLAAKITGWLLGLVDSDPLLEISLTTVLAYLSFLVAEAVFHVSGVMATVTAGIVMGGTWGKAKISPDVSHYLHHFWEFMAYVANALIFLLVGLRVELSALANSLDLLLWVLVAMLISRAVVIYLLVPVSGRFSTPVARSYQHVMYWGGLRGAIALAIALSLGDLPYAETFVALVTGAVLFTLIVQGLTIEKLVHRLGLDIPELAEQINRADSLLQAKRKALQILPELQSGGMFSLHIAKQWQQSLTAEIDLLSIQQQQRRQQQFSLQQERMLLLTRCLTTEQAYYGSLFARGHISEQAFQDLSHSIDLQLDAVRQQRPLPDYTLHTPSSNVVQQLLLTSTALLHLTALRDRLNVDHIARNYEEAWGRHQGSEQVLRFIDSELDQSSLSKQICSEVRAIFQHWREESQRRLDATANQFGEFVAAMQNRLAGRLLGYTQIGIIEQEAKSGALPSGIAQQLVADIRGEIRQLKGSDVSQLEISPLELLRKVPFFLETPESEFTTIAKQLQRRMIPEGETIIKQDSMGQSLFLIARGVVRVVQQQPTGTKELATLFAGDFFGEMALLHHAPRTASCIAVTPCAMYELQKSDIDNIRSLCPAMQQALLQADNDRRTI